MKNYKDKVISIRLSEEMLNALDSYAVSNEKDRTQVIRNAISHYLNLEESLEDKIEKLTKRQNTLDNLLTNFDSQLQHQSEKTNNIETRLEELRTIISVTFKASND